MTCALGYVAVVVFDVVHVPCHDVSDGARSPDTEDSVRKLSTNGFAVPLVNRFVEAGTSRPAARDVVGQLADRSMISGHERESATLPTMMRLDDRFRELLLAYERLGASWRRRYSLTANEKLVLMFLSVEGPLSPTKLSQYAGLTTAGMSALLDRLEAGEYLQRERMLDDRRRVLVTLSTKGVAARLEFERSQREIDDAAVEVFSEQERATIARFLAIAAEALERQA
jgi:DNA-binding MarR family transcriptional regulator